MKKGLVFLLFAALIANFSCRREQPLAQAGVELKFSADTVFLDTVFSTVGSSTYTLKVFNPTDERVVIDNIRLDSIGSPYRLNIDGVAGNSRDEVEILANDSIYIFIEVTSGIVSAQQLVVEDAILFTNKGTEQDVTLVTLARDAHFHFPTNYLTSGQQRIPVSLLDCNETWAADKPHVVYGYALVDSLCRLTILPGAEVHFHNGAGLWVLPGGQLIADGGDPGFSDSITFQGNRLEPFYEDAAGQWGGALGGIFIQQGGPASILKNIVIKNATTALRLDSVTEGAPVQVELSESYILNNSRTAIYGGFGNLKAENVVVANSGLASFYAFGGSYQFRHCTFANYWDGGTRSQAAVILSNVLDVGLPQLLVRDLRQARFENCIITGNKSGELAIIKDESGVLDYYVDHAIIKVDENVTDPNFEVTDPVHFNAILKNADPDFRDFEMNRYALDTNSQAVDQGDAGLGLPTDIRGNLRNVGQPDLGAFERQF